MRSRVVEGRPSCEMAARHGCAAVLQRQGRDGAFDQQAGIVLWTQSRAALSSFLSSLWCIP